MLVRCVLMRTTLSNYLPASTPTEFSAMSRVFKDMFLVRVAKMSRHLSGSSPQDLSFSSLRVLLRFRSSTNSTMVSPSSLLERSNFSKTWFQQRALNRLSWYLILQLFRETTRRLLLAATLSSMRLNQLWLKLLLLRLSRLRHLLSRRSPSRFDSPSDSMSVLLRFSQLIYDRRRALSQLMLWLQSLFSERSRVFRQDWVMICFMQEQPFLENPLFLRFKDTMLELLPLKPSARAYKPLSFMLSPQSQRIWRILLDSINLERAQQFQPNLLMPSKPLFDKSRWMSCSFLVTLCSIWEKSLGWRDILPMCSLHRLSLLDMKSRTGSILTSLMNDRSRPIILGLLVIPFKKQTRDDSLSLNSLTENVLCTLPKNCLVNMRYLSSSGLIQFSSHLFSNRVERN